MTCSSVDEITVAKSSLRYQVTTIVSVTAARLIDTVSKLRIIGKWLFCSYSSVDEITVAKSTLSVHKKVLNHSYQVTTSLTADRQRNGCFALTITCLDARLPECLFLVTLLFYE